MPETLLQVRDLKVSLRLDRLREVTVLDGVSFTLDRGEILGLVGESGSGKTLTASAIMGLLPQAGRIAGGQIFLEGVDLTRLTARQMRTIRGQKIAMVFQDPLSSLNPIYRIETQMREALSAHGQKVPAKEAREICANMLRKAGLTLPETRLRQFPHQLSGGQRQRVLIAMALLSNPAVLIADEPTSSLDVTVQAQIMELLRTIQRETKTAVLLISHDLGVVAETADRVMVMYAGQVVEYGTTEAVFTRPLHPYTQKLIGSIPRADRDAYHLEAIRGTVPPLDLMPEGCRFVSRCPYRAPLCEEQQPRPRFCEGGTHSAMCHFVHSQWTK